uniref:Uncharacterized protein n=1 Tax=viral metagenome TaxID=1070528 RepID=A0A6C0BQV4_9ZZZZ
MAKLTQLVPLFVLICVISFLNCLSLAPIPQVVGQLSPTGVHSLVNVQSISHDPQSTLNSNNESKYSV